MPAEANEDNAAARAAASRPDHLPQHGLIASFAVIALGAMLASAGIAKLFVTPGEVLTPNAFVCLAIGVVSAAAGVLRALKQLRAMPPADCDCDRYGRHMIGLTFLLLVIGLSNAVGTSVLALQGGLGFSASVLIDASDPEQLKKATENLAAAQVELKQATRAAAVFERKKLRAEQQLQKACAPGVGVGPEVNPCAAAQAALAAASAEWENTEFARQDLNERVEGATKACQDKRADCKRALFFLLSLSTMMSLFGASFYVVNSVRSKRPPPPPGAANGTWNRSSFADAPSWARSSEPVNAASDGTTASPIASPPEPQRGEPFDVHAFWSGAFFRVGEAVLFTFAFFWLIWTSGPRTSVVWLPVLGLFVGMFVKSGEAVIFRLGMRVLYAVEALLPAAAPAPREEAPSGSGTTPSGSAEPRLDKLAGGRA